MASRTWALVTWRPRMSLSQPSFVSPTTGLTEPTLSFPGRPSVQSMTASAAVGTLRVLVRTMGVSMRAELLDLGHPGQLAVAVPDRDPGRDLVLEDVAAVGDDGRDARPDVFAFDERDLADLDPGDVGDGVERPGREDADDEPEFPGPGPVFGGQGGSAPSARAPGRGRCELMKADMGLSLTGHGALIIRRRAANDKRPGSGASGWFRYMGDTLSRPRLFGITERP